MKDFFKIVIMFTILLVLALIAVWGANTSNSDTETGWNILGAALFYGITILPAGVFWQKQIMYVIDLEE